MAPNFWGLLLPFSDDLQMSKKLPRTISRWALIGQELLIVQQLFKPSKMTLKDHILSLVMPALDFSDSNTVTYLPFFLGLCNLMFFIHYPRGSSNCFLLKSVQLTLNAYEEDCEFADPAGSFKGLRRFKRDCSNFGSLIEKSNMKLMKWEDFENKGVGHWRFSCVMSFPWRPILSATGYTEYYFDAQSAKLFMESFQARGALERSQNGIAEATSEAYSGFLRNMEETYSGLVELLIDGSCHLRSNLQSIQTGFMILMYFFESYLDLRQHAALKLPTLPKTLEGVISQEKFEKSRAYSLDKSHFHFVQEFVTILMDSAILFFGILPWFWKKSGNFLPLVGLNAENEILHTLAFLAGVMMWSQITDLPFSLYSTFVIEARHGFNKQTMWLFFRDLIKGMCLAIVLGPPIVSAIIVIVQKGGPYLAIYLWAFMFVLSLVMMTLYPVLIAPLFNKFTPLPQGELRLKIEKLASSLNFPLKKLFVVDGSTRSSHSNAYMYGFYKNKRIVLYDTLIQQCKNDEEIVAVISHELGHWKLNHTMYSFIAVQILTFLQFGGYTLVRNSTDLFRSFGFDTQPVLIGLIIFQHTVIPIQHLVSFGLNLVSRSFEFQADAFAKKLGYGAALRVGLVKLQEENLSAMNTDPWYSAYHYSHPPLVERLGAIDEPDKKED
ncbi:hypothetical protein CRYUN_Cryun23aG0135300 [Craigia yunnanensis]